MKIINVNRKNIVEQIITAIFFIFIFLLPSNLGKHFIYKFSYVNGLLVDYMVPTVYLQDILLVILVFLFLFLQIFQPFRLNLRSIEKNFLRIYLIFIFSMFLSVFSSLNYYSSLYFFIRLISMSLGVFIVCIGFKHNILKHSKLLFHTLCASILLIGILAILQWFHQGSIFNNYLVFGEQTYDHLSRGVLKEVVLGVKVIPPYSTFRHPNILAGFLSISLVWIYNFLLRGISVIKLKKGVNIFVISSFVVGVVSLFLTFSVIGIASFLFGIIASVKPWEYFSGKIKFEKEYFLILVIILSIISLFVPLLKNSNLYLNPSISVRGDLLNVAFSGIQNNWLFGLGLNASYEYFGLFISPLSMFPVPQPVHNVFVLLFLESGIFSLISFVTLLLYSLYIGYKNNSIFYITILQIFILSSFDHYIFTNHSTMYLLWLTLAFLFAYNDNADKAS